MIYLCNLSTLILIFYSFNGLSFVVSCIIYDFFACQSIIVLIICFFCLILMLLISELCLIISFSFL
ncbi:putative membrane protein [Synechococcus sp. A15-62]|nr:putative membrane protein [Synechococcus sp. A15-62]